MDTCCCMGPFLASSLLQVCYTVVREGLCQQPQRLGSCHTRIPALAVEAGLNLQRAMCD
jgi:hypothetical protein